MGNYLESEKIIKEEKSENINDKSYYYEKYGKPYSDIKLGVGFAAHSYEEDCFLMGGGFNDFTDRVEWVNPSDKNSPMVVYFNKEKVVQIFNLF
jgi:hypothetical protein